MLSCLSARRQKKKKRTGGRFILKFSLRRNRLERVSVRSRDWFLNVKKSRFLMTPAKNPTGWTRKSANKKQKYLVYQTSAFHLVVTNRNSIAITTSSWPPALTLSHLVAEKNSFVIDALFFRPKKETKSLVFFWANKEWYSMTDRMGDWLQAPSTGSTTGKHCFCCRITAETSRPLPRLTLLSTNVVWMSASVAASAGNATYALVAVIKPNEHEL